LSEEKPCRKHPKNAKKTQKTAHSRRRLHSYNLKETITSDKMELIILVNLFLFKLTTTMMIIMLKTMLYTFVSQTLHQAAHVNKHSSKFYCELNDLVESFSSQCSQSVLILVCNLIWSALCAFHASQCSSFFCLLFFSSFFTLDTHYLGISMLF